MAGERNYDVIVAGLGAWGSATAWQLARRGHRVLGVDRFEPPHDQGSHSGTTRLARRGSHEGVEYAPLTRRSFELWEELSSEHGVPLVATTGALLFGAADDELIEVSAASLDNLGLPYELLNAEQVARRFPSYRLHAGEVALFEPDAAVILSAEGIRAHLSGAAARGAAIRTGERVVNWEDGAAGVVVETEFDRYTAERLVLTLGAWNPGLLGIELPLRVERQILVTFDTGDWATGLPCFFSRCLVLDGRKVGVYGAPEPDGRFKVALHHGGVNGDPEELSREATAEDVEHVLREVRERLPDVAEAPTTAKVCLYTNSPDAHWILGAHPDAPHTVFATGCSGRGYRYSPAIGEALANLVEGTALPDLEFLSKDRFAPSSGR